MSCRSSKKNAPRRGPVSARGAFGLHRGHDAVLACRDGNGGQGTIRSFLANSTTCAPGTSSERSPGARLTMGTSAGITIFFSPLAYLTVIVRPLLVTRSPTVPFVIVLFLPRSHARWPSPVAAHRRREYVDFERLQRAVGLRHGGRADVAARLDVRYVVERDAPNRRVAGELDVDVLARLGVHFQRVARERG